jgi:ParB family chromosome partitioning protein
MKTKSKYNKKKDEKIKKPGKKRLGMGLSSLLSKDAELSAVIKSKISEKVKNSDNFNVKRPSLGVAKISKLEVSQAASNNNQQMLPIQNLVSGKFQPRKNFDLAELDELAESIKANGILQPILVRPLTKGGSSYEIIAGERRWRASQIAKIHEVPVIIRDFDDETALGVAMIENLQRSDLNLIEEAEGYRALMHNFQYTQEKLSSQLGKSRSHIANVLRILSLPKYVRSFIVKGELSFGHARALVPLSEDKSKEITDQIIDMGLSVRQTENLVNKEKRTDNQHYQTKSNYSTEHVNPNIEFLEKELTTLLGLKIEFSHKANNSGKMSILYKSLDQIQPVIDKLKWRPK